MIWIGGISPLEVAPAYVASAVALVVFGVPAALQQNSHQPIVRHLHAGHHVDWARVGVGLFMVVAAVVTNVTVNYWRERL